MADSYDHGAGDEELLGEFVDRLLDRVEDETLIEEAAAILVDLALLIRRRDEVDQLSADQRRQLLELVDREMAALKALIEEIRHDPPDH